MKKNLLVLAAALCVAMTAAACSPKTGTDTGAAESTAAGGESEAGDSKAASEGTGKTLVMATNAEFPPYEYYEGGEVVGIDAEIAKAIADQLGMELKIEDMSFDSTISAVASGKADMVLAGLTVDPDRAENVDFSDTYAQASQVIIVRSDSDVSGPDSLAGKKVGVQQGTTGDLYVTDKLGDDAVERYMKGFEAVEALKKERIDAIVIDREPAKVFVSENEGLKILDEAYTEEEYAIAVKKGNKELLDQINGVLKELKDSGELQKIVDKYITAE